MSDTSSAITEGSMKKYIAETFGTFFLVFLSCGSALFAGEQIGFVGISMTFGLSLIAAAYAIGPISGCHINPAVTIGAFFAGRMDSKEVPGYIIGQFLGATIAALMLFILVSGKAGGHDIAANGFANNSWGDNAIYTAFLFEVIATAIFVMTILGVTQNGPQTMIAGLIIGLTLIGIHLMGIPITGTSVNPARSFGPALFAGGAAIAQLWLFIIAPIVGAIIAGLLFKHGVLSAPGEK